MRSTFSVLLIDDNAIDGMIHTKVLEKSHMSDVVYFNQSGTGALDFLKNLGNIKVSKGQDLFPKFIFLDFDMPTMDGFQFMASFEKLSVDITNDTKIVVLTASDQDQDRELPKKFKNFHAYMAKPLTQEKIDSL